MASKGESTDRVLAYLRRAGFSKGQSVWVLAKAAGYSLDEAKKLTHLSEVWSDRRVSDEQFHESLVRAVGPREEDKG